MSKKVLALVLALVMVLGSFGTVSAQVFPDTEGAVSEEAVDRLSLLGVLEGYPDGTFKPENTITRAEFAAVAMRLRGLEGAAEAATGLPTGFTDVPTYHWASGYVGTAGKLGVVNGIGGGLFAPEAPVKYEEAVTMVVRALGYEAAAQQKGGYPYGYLIVANEIDLLDDVKGTQGQPAPRGLVAQIADNALEIPMMIQVGFGSDAKWVVSGSAEHGDDAEEQYLLDAMGFEKFEGRVQFDKDFDDQITLINEFGKKEVLDVQDEFDFYEVEGVVITTWSDDDDLVIAYTLEEEVLFDAVEYKDEDEITLVGADKDYDLADFDGDNDEYDLEIYFEREEVKEKGYDKDFKADYAKIVLNDDGDVIFVDAYDFDGFIVANEVEDEEILDLNDDELDTEDFLIVKDGKTIAVEDVEEGDIVFYNEAEEFAVVFNDSVTGEVERVYTNAPSFKLDGETYDYNQGYDSLYLDEGELEELDADILEGMMDEESEVEVFFDFKGDVVLVVGVSGLVTNDQYAVLTDNAVVYEGRKGQMLALDLLNSAGEKVSYDIEVADLKGENPEIKNDIITDINAAIDADTTVYAQKQDDGKEFLFEISIDKDGDVEEIYKRDVVAIGGEGFEIDDKYVDADGKDYRLQSSTVVFYDYDGSEYDEVVALGEAEGIFSEVDNGFIYVVDGEVEVVLAFETDADTDTTDYTGLVTDAYVTKDDEIEFTIEVLGKEMEFTTDEDYDLAKIEENGVVENITAGSHVSRLENKIVTLAVSDSTGLVEDIEVEEGIPVSFVATDINTSSRTIKNYELVRNAVIYEANSDDTISLRELRDDYTTATVYTEENSPRFVQYVVAGTAIDGGEDVATDGTVTYIAGTEFAVTLPSDAKATDTFIVKVGTDNATVVNGKANLTPATAWVNGTLKTAELYNIADLNKVLASHNFVVKAAPASIGFKAESKTAAGQIDVTIATVGTGRRVVTTDSLGNEVNNQAAAATVTIAGLVPGNTYTVKLVEGATVLETATVKVITAAELEAATAESEVAADKAALVLGYTSPDTSASVTDTLTLASTGTNTTIAWTSSNTTVVKTDGTVTRPAAGSGDVTVTLTATLTHDTILTVKDTKVFTVVVKDELTQAEVDAAAADTFKTTHATALAKTLATVVANDNQAGQVVKLALDAYAGLTPGAKALLVAEKAHLDDLAERSDAIKDLNNALVAGPVVPADVKAAIEAEALGLDLTAYNALPLESLRTQAIADFIAAYTAPFTTTESVQDALDALL